MSAKKVTSSAAHRRGGKSTKVVATKKHSSPSHHAHRPGYTHSKSLSNNALMGLAIFFALVGLFVIMTYQKQSADFERYQTAHNQESLKYLARPATPTPKAMRK